MLYDPKWETKTEPLSLTSLIPWLERQPRSKKYDPTVVSNCLLAQWLRSMDPESSPDYNPDFTSFAYHFRGTTAELLGFKDIVFGGGSDFERTFGAALGRARRAAELL